MTMKFSPTLVDEGTWLHSICQTDEANPAVNIEWMKTRQLITTNDDNVKSIIDKEFVRRFHANFSASLLSITGSRENHLKEFVCVVMDAARVPRLIAGPTHFAIKGMNGQCTFIP
jgi:hypothetical protein